MNTCVNCGTRLPEGQKWCAVCGTAQPQQSQQPVYQQSQQPVYQQPQQPVYQQPLCKQPAREQPVCAQLSSNASVQTRKKRNLPLIIGIIGGIVVLIIVLTQAWNDHRSASTFEHTLVGEWAGVTAVVDGREIDLTNWDVSLTFESDRTGYTTAGVLVGRTTLRFTWEYTHINNLGDLCYTCYLPNNETMYVVRNPLDEEVTLIMGENASVLFTPAD